jgi:polar amino acid transport system permease protein
MEQISQFIERVIPVLWQGTIITLQLASVSLLLGMALGLPMGVLRVYGPAWVRRLVSLVSLYVLVFQGTPLLVQLFVIYYGLPQLGLTMDRFPAAYVALGLHSAAYQAEYLRGALQSVGEGQMTAARAIGMSRFQAIVNIILPQAFRLVLPAWSNEVVSMIKYTAVVYLIAVPDLMGQAKNLSSKFFQPIPIYLTAAVFYLVLVGITYFILREIERRLHVPGLTIEHEG